MLTSDHCECEDRRHHQGEPKCTQPVEIFARHAVDSEIHGMCRSCAEWNEMEIVETLGAPIRGSYNSDVQDNSSPLTRKPPADLDKIIEILRQDRRLLTVTNEYPGCICVRFAHSDGQIAAMWFGTVNETWMGDLYFPEEHQETGNPDNHSDTGIPISETDPGVVARAIIRSIERDGSHDGPCTPDNLCEHCRVAGTDPEPFQGANQ